MADVRSSLWHAVSMGAETGARWLSEIARVGRFRAESRRFRSRPDDVYVASYPRSGTTWMQTLVHLLLRSPSASLKLDFAHIDDVVPWFERSLSVGLRRAADFEVLATPRCFKTHLVPRHMPARGRVILMRRNTLEMGISYHRLYADYLGFRGSRHEFFERMAAGRVQYGSPAAHWKAWSSWPWPVLRVDYDALRANPGAEATRVAAFLGVERSRHRIDAVCEACSIDAMRAAQDKFDHATSLLRERGVRAGQFIRDGRPAEGIEASVVTLAQRVDAGLGAEQRAPLSAFLR